MVCVLIPTDYRLSSMHKLHGRYRCTLFTGAEFYVATTTVVLPSSTVWSYLVPAGLNIGEKPEASLFTDLLSPQSMSG